MTDNRLFVLTQRRNKLPVPMNVKGFREEQIRLVEDPDDKRPVWILSANIMAVVEESVEIQSPVVGEPPKRLPCSCVILFGGGIVRVYEAPEIVMRKAWKEQMALDGVEVER